MERAPSDTASHPAPVDLEPANPLPMERAPSDTMDKKWDKTVHAAMFPSMFTSATQGYDAS